MKIAFHTLGCKVNQYETEAMKEQFARDGHQIVGESDFADVYIINTCTVTGLADRKSRQYIRRMKKKNPRSVVAVTGCYVQVNPDEVSSLPEVDILAGVNEKHRIIDYVDDFRRQRGEHLQQEHILERGDLSAYEEMGTITSMESRTRAYIKIEEGCDRFCSYCVIPYARGPVRSRSEDAILREAASLVKAGFKELILTGINTALYADLPSLLAKLDEMEGVFRVRLSSLEPTVIDADSVKELFGFKRLCHHLHLSMQSGSDRVLAAMGRPYDREDFFRIVDELRKFDPLYGITTDMIVGFPGETEEDFLDTLDAVDRVRFGKVHAFRYSDRPGTAASAMAEKIDPALKKERAERLAQKGEAAAAAFFAENEGATAQVLFEQPDEEDGTISGYAGNYIRVYTDLDRELENEFADVVITHPYRDGVYGKRM
ncbi:MAG: tRNA (N(6)-L-threonylcarbamoyladenosine(37)-C(2))-methylthiotransferase MtaB [Anaerovoracaceae bacterium]|jgi:threonylcarbamoyladenosine tRNA methylthiotransferase MtaB